MDDKLPLSYWTADYNHTYLPLCCLFLLDCHIQSYQSLQNLLLFILFNSLKPRQNRRHFADDLLKCNFFNENVWILIEVSLKCVPKGPINNNPALVQIMAWHRSGDKPLSEWMMVGLPMHICITLPQWVDMNSDVRVRNDIVTLLMNITC